MRTILARKSRFGLAVLVACAAVLGGMAAAVAADQFPAAPAWTVVFKWQRCPSWFCETGWYASPAVADLDKDGQTEVFGAAIP